ncbi:MAG TPA: hypothetical protein VFA33_08350 [Bryobacteraceae bacterium]|nr:hypothetical protein [Bryobacteraceae bacterium]
MADKPKVAFYWCAACGGCEEAIVDLGEGLLEVAAAVEIVFWPVALDFKRRDIEQLADHSLAAAFVNGAIRTGEQEEMARLLSAKAQLLFAFGSCAHLGGIPGLANLFTSREVLATAYPPDNFPRHACRDNGHALELPELFDTVRPLDQVVPVDYYVPGCPPTPRIIQSALQALLSDTLPPRGSVLAPDVALCEECPRKDSRPPDLTVAAFHRPHQIVIDEEKCMLAQGILCLGPATRGGCEAPCIRGNMPCTGCFGPTSRVRDFGGKALSAVASVAADEAALEAIPDPVGAFYRYSLPASLLRRKKNGGDR